MPIPKDEIERMIGADNAEFDKLNTQLGLYTLGFAGTAIGVGYFFGIGPAILALLVGIACLVASIDIQLKKLFLRVNRYTIVKLLDDRA